MGVAACPEWVRHSLRKLTFFNRPMPLGYIIIVNQNLEHESARRIRPNNSDTLEALLGGGPNVRQSGLTAYGAL